MTASHRPPPGRLLPSGFSKLLLAVRQLALPFIAAAVTLSSRAAAYEDTLQLKFLLSGATMTEQECKSVEETVWVVAGGKGDCIRYYSAGLASGKNELVIAFFHGDRLERHYSKNFLNTTGYSAIGYSDNNPEKLNAMMQQLFQQSRTPAIFVGRPGVYGSSGDHRIRRNDREVDLMAGALQKIKERYGIRHFILAGQSGGGHITAGILAKRNDIACAVISSGATAVRARIDWNSWPADSTGLKNFYDPIDHVADIPKGNGLRIFVVGDPRDKAVPFVTQEKYYDALRKQKLDAYLLPTQGAGSQFHGLAPLAQKMAGWCAEGLPSDEIISRAKEKS